MSVLLPTTPLEVPWRTKRRRKHKIILTNASIIGRDDDLEFEVDPSCRVVVLWCNPVPMKKRGRLDCQPQQSPPEPATGHGPLDQNDSHSITRESPHKNFSSASMCKPCLLGPFWAIIDRQEVLRLCAMHNKNRVALVRRRFIVWDHATKKQCKMS